MVVEDDADISESMLDALEIEGHSVRAFRNGQDALVNLRSGELPRLILLDLMMPTMDGWKFLEAKKQSPAPIAQIPVVILSAVADMKRTSTVGDYEYIKKPLDLEELLHVVEKYVPLSPARDRES